MVRKARNLTLLVISGLMLLAAPSLAQDPGFTQFYANPMYLNPAFAGTSVCPRIAMNYRNQWPALSGTYVTYSASYDQHSNALNGGLGVHLMNDRQGEGTLNTTTLSGIYSYKMDVNRKFAMKWGFQASIFQKTIDWPRLTFGDQIDPKYGFIYQTQEIPGQNTKVGVDFSAGFLGYSEKFFFGGAVHHLTEPDETLISGQSRLPRKYTVHAGAAIPLAKRKEDGVISPNIMYQRQGDFNHLNLGVYLSKGPLVGGLWFRNADAFIALLGIQTGRVKIGYSYDITISKLSGSGGGAHEMSFQLQLPCRVKRRKLREVSCPSF